MGILYHGKGRLSRKKKCTFNPGAKRWFLPLYLALWSFTTVAAAQLGMILWVWLRLR